MFSSITITIISSAFCLFLCFLFLCLFYFLLRTEPSFVFLCEEEKRKHCLNQVIIQPLRFPKPELQSSSPCCFVFAHFFSQCEHPFIDNPMIITELAVTCASQAIKPGFETISQQRAGFCQSCSRNEHIILLALLKVYGNYAGIELFSLNYASRI